MKFWEDNQIFQKSLDRTLGKQPYVFYDGPPFATGLPHYGHILGSAVKDAFGRYYTMNGRYVRRVWGWDCHGLPIENIVEQNLKISGKKQIEEVGVQRFNQVCRDNVLKFVEEWGKTVRRMGRWVDFGPLSLWSSSSSERKGGPSDEALAKSDDHASADSASKKNLVGPRNSYKTMDTTYMESVWWALKQIWDKGLIYEDRKVLLYCSRCETPISNFEVAMDNSYRDVTEESVYAKFKLLPRQRIINDLTNDKTYMLAWTTTPWTLPGNTSLNIGPGIKYVLVEQNNERYILAKDLLKILDGEYEIVSEFPARSLDGLEYEPLYPGVIPNARNSAEFNAEQRGNIVGDPNRAHRLYLADFVTTEDGTGIVHNAAMYGEEDYELAKEKNLPRLDMLDHKGQYLANARVPKHLQGVFFKDAEKIVLKDLKERNLVYKTLNYTHSYPHCYRCGTPLFYNALPAWFINIQKIKPDLLKHNKNINWYPGYLKEGRFANSVAEAPDWNISRNRYWATALPFWKCQNKECKSVICVGSVSELIERSINFKEVYPQFTTPSAGADTPPMQGGETPRLSQQNLGESPPAKEEYPAIAGGGGIESLDLHRPYIDQIILKCPQCGGQMLRVPEVVDCWVESGSMPFAELHYPFENKELYEQRKIADFVAEYIAQTRAWFYVMDVMSVALFGHEPFKNVVTTGNIRAEDGAKMSKSLKNYPDPALVIERYGVDAVRFYLLTCPVMNGDDVNFSEKSVQEISRKISLLLYNIWSFYRLYEKSVIADFVILKPEDFPHILDKWMLSRLHLSIGKITQDMDAYNTVRAGREMIDLMNDISTWYVRRSRERIKSGSDDSRQALTVLGYVLAQISKVLAPFMPFLADFIYKDITGKESVHLEIWPKAGGADPSVTDVMVTVRAIVEQGLSLRKENNLKVRQPLAEIEYHLKEKNNLLGPELEKVLAEELNVKLVSGRSDFVPKAGWAYRETPGFKLALNLELSDELKKKAWRASWNGWCRICAKRAASKSASWWMFITTPRTKAWKTRC